jgi:hypothetical protein
VNALLERRIKVLYVTHLYELAHGFFSERNATNAIFLRAERQADGTRTFRLAEGEPLQTSYGQDLYNGIFGALNQTRSSNEFAGGAIEAQAGSSPYVAQS